LYGKILLTFNLPITQYYSNIMHNLHTIQTWNHQGRLLF
jgi:hypothetical protein